MEKKLLAFEHPELIKDWDFKKNESICSPDEVVIGSHKIVWWKCHTCGFEWNATPKNRGNLKSGCPACSGKVAVKGFNDFKSLHPELMEEWDFDKNEYSGTSEPLCPVLRATHSGERAI